MSTQRYSVAPHPIETLLTWVKSGEIAIPEIQRPFVWDATKVRNLLDSLYRGYPVGYLIAWRNPTVRLKDGSPSAGKRILIDGQQRITALMASILGHEVLTEDYETIRIRIAFHPIDQRFEVANPAIRHDTTWIDDVSKIFAPESRMLQTTRDYVAANPGVSEDSVFETLEKLRRITSNHVGIIELAEDLDIATVTEIFIRVNSAGSRLDQADFAMSKIAANDTYGGTLLRKAIDYFCHCSKSPEHMDRIAKSDPAFASSEFLPAIRWLRSVNDDIYDPSYTDMLRVAFASEFRRGKLQDLVALLSGRNFETKQHEEAIAERSFGLLKRGVLSFINQTHFERFTMIIRSAGFVTSDLVGARNNLNFAYILYLLGRTQGLPPSDLERLVRRWYALSVLTARYSAGNPETDIDYDMRQLDSHGILPYCESVLSSQLNANFWDNLLPLELETSFSNNARFLAFHATLVKANDRGFLSRDITVQDLLLNRSDLHHVYPKKYLKSQGSTRGEYNQIANLVMAQSEINIAIGDKPPDRYFAELGEQVSGGKRRYGGISDPEDLRANLRSHCIPLSMLDGPIPSYRSFLEERRLLMARKMRAWFDAL
jgi:hypothetical protein